MNAPPVRRQPTITAPAALGGLAIGGAAPRNERLRAESARTSPPWRLDGRDLGPLQAISDLLAAYAAILVAVGGVPAAAEISSRNAPLLALPPLVMLQLYVRGAYRTRLCARPLESLTQVVGAVSVATMAVVVLGLLVDGQAPAQASWLLGWMLAVLSVGASRACLSVGRGLARRRGLIGRPVLIVGAGVVGAQVARCLELYPGYGLWPVGFLDDHPRSAEALGTSRVTILGRVTDADDIVASTGVRDVIVAFSSVADAQLSRLIGRCQERGVDVSVVPRMFDAINNQVTYDSVGGVPLLCFQTASPRGGGAALNARLRARARVRGWGPDND